MIESAPPRAQSSEALVRLLAQHTRDMLLICSPLGVVKSVSDACRIILGFEPAELVGKSYRDLVHPEDWPATVTERLTVAREDSLQSTLRTLHANGTWVWLETNTYIARDDDGHPGEIIAVSRDVTARKRAEDAARGLEASLRLSETRARAMLDAVPDMIFRMDHDGTYLDYRIHSDDELYSPPEAIIGGNVRALMPTIANEVLALIARTLASHSMQSWEYQLAMPGGVRDYEARMVPSGPAEVLTMVRDITALKSAERNLRQALREKEVLLKELHHRVKNNLQVISSLLKLQAMQTDHPDVSKFLAQSQDRVISIALVHDQLYRSHDVSVVAFDIYAKLLVENLFDAYDAPARGIRARFSGDDVALPVDQAIPSGLILNELVTNALKHAFCDRGGTVTVRLSHVEPDGVELVVGDDGAGLPTRVDPQKSQSLGLELVRTLAAQLGAEVVFTRADLGAGTIVTLRFRRTS